MVKLRMVLVNIISISILLQSCHQDDSPTPIITSEFQWNWARLLNGPTNEDEVDAVASDVHGNVYLSGKFENELTIAGHSSSLISNGKADIMVVKYNKDGDLQWVRHYGGIGEDNIFDAACDASGNVYLSGFFDHEVQFDDHVLTAQGEWDMVVLKLNPEGEVLWVKQYGGESRDGGNEIEIGNNDQLIVAAQSEGTFEGISNTGNQDAYMLSLSSLDGSINWVRSVQGAGYTRAKAIAIDQQGNAYLGGDYLSASYIDNNGTITSFENYGDTDAYLASWTSEGAFRWVKTWGGTDNDLCKGVTVNSQNDLYVVTPFRNTINLDGMELTSVGANDLVVWKMNSEGHTEWLRHISGSENLYGAELATDSKNNLVFGMSLWGTVTFGSGNTGSEVISGGTDRTPILVSYNSEGTFLQYIVATESWGDAHFGEISISNNTAYIDCEITGGPHTFDSETFTSQDNSKDAVVVSIELNK